MSRSPKGTAPLLRFHISTSVTIPVLMVNRIMAGQERAEENGFFLFRIISFRCLSAHSLPFPDQSYVDPHRSWSSVGFHD